MPLSTGTRLGPYEILAPIGAGAMGEVYRARDARLGRDVALKVLPEVFSKDAERMARFGREAQLLASLNHPNIAALYGLEESDGARALVMELVEGPTLAERIATGPIPFEEALPIARQIAEALEAAHDKGIIHRDLKPANVKVTRDGAVKVLDFGLAKALDDDPVLSGAAHSPTMSLAATRAGVILGTAAYMSPEQAKGKSVDRRADVWAFGVVLYEMPTGGQLYSGETAAETLAAVMKDQVDWGALPPETPPAIRKLLRRCLEKDVRQRVQAIGDARIAMEEGEPEAAGPGGPARPGGAALLPWSVAAVAALMALAVSVVHFREKPPEAQPTRFQVFPPEKTHFDGSALSPDGRRLALVIHDGNKHYLTVRPMNSVTAQSLGGADDAGAPFWSPDSRFLAFFAGNKLKKMEIGGGPPQTLCDAPAGNGGDWSRDGVILFANRGGELFRVPAAGGVPARVPTPDGEVRRVLRFLPDSRHYLFEMGGGRRSAGGGVYFASLDSPRATRLVEGAGAPAFAPSTPEGDTGHLLFLRGTTVMAQRFDAARRRLSGDPFPVAEQVNRLVLYGAAAYSVSTNGTLAWRTGSSVGESQLLWFDREGRSQAASAPGGHRDLALSPDGKQVAVSEGGADNTDIWLLEWTRGIRSRLTFDPAQDSHAVWSPDGSRIAFVSRRDGPGNLYWKASSGAGNEELLLKSDGPMRPTDWSRDGRYLAYSRLDSKTRADLWVLPLSGDRKPQAFLQTEFNESHGQISPDGRFLAYQSDETGKLEVYVRPFPSGTGGKWQVSSGGGAQPRWRRDGKEMFYVAPGRKVMSVSVTTGTAFQSAAPKALFDTPMAVGGPYANQYAVTADGQRFLVIALPESDASPVVVALHWSGR